MGRVRRLLARCRSTVRPSRAARETAREVDAHLALLEEAYRSQGLQDADARRKARLAMGGLDQTKELHRDARMFVLLDDVQRDVRYALRSLARTPGFTFVAVLTLALGIGANAAIFSVVHAVLLAPLPFKNPDRLMTLYENVPGAETRDGRPRRQPGLEKREFLEVRAHARTLSEVTTSGLALVSVAGATNDRESELTTVSSDTFQMLGMQPILGRWFTPDDEQPGHDKVVILSYPAWQKYFGGDPDVLGKTLAFNGNTFSTGIALGMDFTVVGVMPLHFHYPNDGTEFWAPLAVTPPANPRARQLTGFTARLADGVSAEQAAAEVSAIVHGARAASPNAPQPAPGTSWDLPDGVHPRFEFVRVQDQIGATVKPALLVLSGAVGFVLLIACANVANLLLARTAARHREIAVRSAVGAGRGRLIRQLLTESVLLSLIGGSAGIVFAFGGVHLFRTLATNLGRVDLGSLGDLFPRLDAIAIDGPVLLFVLAASTATGVTFGLLPALRYARSSEMDALRGTAGTSATAPVRTGRITTQGMLVVLELSVATTLAIGGALLINSFVKLAHVDPGYDASNVLTFQVGLPGTAGSPGTDRPTSELKKFADDLTARIESIPGVQATAYANQLPLVKLQNSMQLSRSPNATRPAVGTGTPSPNVGADVQLVSRGYLKVMGARVVAGRSFNDGDTAGRPQVLVINRALAARDFPDKSPVGQYLYAGPNAAPWEVVGVVDNLLTLGLDRQPFPQFFLTFDQWGSTYGVPVFPAGAYYAVRTSTPGFVMAQISAIARQMEPRASVENVATMNDIVSNEMTRPRMYAVLLGIFAGVAVLLAAAGIYGVMAYAVVQRTREIGIRMALGAQRGEVLGLVLKQGAGLTLVGTALGLAGAAMTTRYLQSLLFGLTPLDGSTFVAASALFAAVAMLASYVPARRATKVDPLIALRAE